MTEETKHAVVDVPVIEIQEAEFSRTYRAYLASDSLTEKGRLMDTCVKLAEDMRRWHRYVRGESQ